MNLNEFMNKGFTLIELLVVISLIGLLSSVVLVGLKGARERAKIGRAQQEMNQIRAAIQTAQHGEGKALRYITGSACCECPCRGVGDLSVLSDSHSCIINMTNCFEKIGLSPLPRDPWGSPYLIDENEYEWAGNPCRRDTLNSAGPDKMYGPAGHDGNTEAYDNDGPRILIPMYSCGL